MLSTNSLSAFSSATTTSALNGQKGTRLVREPVNPINPTGAGVKNAVPNAMPSIAPPRGSLLNLSV